MKRLLEFLINNKSTGIIQDNEFVDLGLSVLWAKYNIGAENETDYGHYYQWGGLEPMDDKNCDWINTPFNNGYHLWDDEYFKSVKDDVCPNDVLSEKYDIAYQTYGNKCHMPTKKQILELINGTNHEWITNYENTSINGIKFTSKQNENNYIFIPAAGTQSAKKVDERNVECTLWGSTVEKTSSYFYSFILKCAKNVKILHSVARCLGLQVRAVKEK